MAPEEEQGLEDRLDCVSRLPAEDGLRVLLQNDLIYTHQAKREQEVFWQAFLYKKN